jgi:GNAT superfamily N-acetyltransferase
MRRVRAATEADTDPVAALSAQLGYSTDAATVATRLRDIAAHHAGVVLVAEVDGGRVAGFACAEARRPVIEEPFVELAALVVGESARGAGVGAELLAAIEAWTRERGFGSVRVRSNVVRERAHRFYLREGYSERKRQAVFVKRLPYEQQTELT